MQEQHQHYELMLIISGSIAEDKHQAIVDSVQKNLAQAGAADIKSASLGRKKFAYAIKNQKHGFYFTLEFNLPAKYLKAINEDLRLNTLILRYLIIRKRVKTAEELENEAKMKAGRIKANLRKEAEAHEEEKRGLYDAKKMSLEDLDKKLDEILEEKII